MTTRADQHDVDKLRRWRGDLAAPNGSVFPVYAIFLVSAEDRAAHDIFRAFRSSFEARRAGFEHLVIFGQHGVSTTVQAMLPVLGLPPDSLPCLALLNGPEAATVYCLPLPPGEGPARDSQGPGDAWRAVLAAVDAGADADNGPVDLDAVPGLLRRQMAAGPLVDLVDRLLADLS